MSKQSNEVVLKTATLDLELLFCSHKLDEIHYSLCKNINQLYLRAV
jgi:hypothetical protein